MRGRDLPGQTEPRDSIMKDDSYGSTTRSAMKKSMAEPFHSLNRAERRGLENWTIRPYFWEFVLSLLLFVVGILLWLDLAGGLHWLKHRS